MKKTLLASVFVFLALFLAAQPVGGNTVRQVTAATMQSTVMEKTGALDYCGNLPYDNRYGSNYNFDWGVMFPASQLTGRNYLSEVMLYVASIGPYTLKVWKGGDTVPGTLVYTQTNRFGNIGWQSMMLYDAVELDDTQNLWVTFSSSLIDHPASACAFTSEPNSDWCSFDGGDTWTHLSSFDMYGTWMVKCITTQGHPMPVVSIEGYDQIGTGAEAYFFAHATTDATVTWTLQGMSSSVVSSTSVQGTWSTAGTYSVIAQATNAYGTVQDTLIVRVVDYADGDTVSYCLDRACTGEVGYNEGGTYWGIKLPSAYLDGRGYLNNVLLYVNRGGEYTMRLYQDGEQNPGTLVYQKTYTVEPTQTGYFGCTPDTLFPINQGKNLWVVFHHPDIDYPAMGCDYMGDPNSDWISADNVNWSHLNVIAPQLPYSWLIQCATSQEELYTLNVQSANPSLGTVTGGGVYPMGTNVTIKAVPHSGYFFVRWNDGNTQIERAVTVTGNATYTAYFTRVFAIDDVSERQQFSIAPNPASMNATISGLTPGDEVRLIDLYGRTLVKTRTQAPEIMLDVSFLPAGVYFVHVGAIVQKLVVK